MFEQSLRHCVTLVLYVNKKKTNLFAYEINFLGHIISQDGIQADPSKVEKILNWPRPKNVKQVQQFLGLVKYLNAFSTSPCFQSSILSRLTTKECEKTSQMDSNLPTSISIILNKLYYHANAYGH
jgi:hypothetical protein